MLNNSMGNLTEEITLGNEITWVGIFVATILYTITIGTVFGNVLVLVAVKANKRLQTTFNYYIVNLAITDVAVAITAMSFKATDTVLGYWPFGEILCAVWIFFDYGMTFVSVFTLIVISLDRLWSVTWSVHYRRHHTNRNCLIAICVIWVFMILLWFPPWLVDRIRFSEPGICYWNPSLNKEFVFVLAALGHHGPFCIMLFCYTYVFIFLRKYTKVTPVGIQDSLVGVEDRSTCITTISSGQFLDNERSSCINDEPQSTLASSSRSFTNTLQVHGRINGQQSNRRRNENIAQRRIRREKRIFVTMTYIVVAYAILWLPFHVVYDISIVDPSLVPDSVLNMAFWMTYFNSTVNPLLYNLSSSEFRKTFKLLLTGKCR